jgi:coproporphyrinogen III oxidase-like Fe-S oxidoreductase
VEPLFRPPSEARSLIFQVTYGCSSDTCTFCQIYRSKRFRKRSESEVHVEFEQAARLLPRTRRIFLADGDALVLSRRCLVSYLETLHGLFPRLERVSAYATPQNLLRRSAADLRAVREAGLEMLYVGMESGSDEVLRRVRKGVSREQIVASLGKAREVGFTTSVTVILGLGGPELSHEHAVETGRALSACAPHYIGALTLMLGEHNASFPSSIGPGFRELTIAETLEEVRAMLAHIECDGATFRANHASNWLALKGRLQADRGRLLEFIDGVLEDPDSPYLRPDYLRAL